MQVTGFEMLDKLGEGGMATVWKARQISLDRIVAIKVLSAQFASDPDDVARFHSEAQSAAKLKHSGIVQVYDASMQEGFYYFIMEFIDGYTVGEWMQRSGELSEKDILLVAECVAEALKHAWEREGIIHCDIKPDNIMIDADGAVKVADLGLARTLSVMGGSNEETATEIMGTPAFMSPEQARGEVRLDCRSDIYSLGATLYYLVTGKLLFEGHTDDEVIDLQIEGSVDDPAAVNPRISRGMRALIRLMLAKDPNDRPCDWSEALRDIRRIKRRMLPARLLKTECLSTIKPSRSSQDAATALRSPGLAEAATVRSGLPWIKWMIVGGSIAVLILLVVLLGRKPDPPPLPAVAWSDTPLASEPVVTSQALSNTEKEAAARDMFEYAREWAREHPDRYSDAIEKFQDVARQTRGTRYVLMANDEIMRLNTQRKKAVDDVMAGLRQKTDDLLKERRFLEAAVAYREYRGPLADETKPRRLRAVQRLEELEREWSESEEQRLAEAARRSEDALATVADTLLTAGYADAIAALDNVVGEPWPDEHKRMFGAIRQALDEAAAVDQKVLRSFRSNAGQDIIVELRSGRLRVRVNAVTDENVQGVEVRQLGTGMMRSPISFGIDDLSPREKLMRMGRDEDPGVILAKGLLAFQSKAQDHARKYFSDLQGSLGESLLSALERAIVQERNQQAEKRLFDLLTRFGIEVPDPFDLDTWSEAIGECSLPADDAQRLRQETVAYRETSAGVPFVDEAEPLLELLDRVQVKAQENPADQLQAERAARVSTRNLRRIEDTTPFENRIRAILRHNPMVLPERDIQIFVDDEDRLRRIEVSSPDLVSMQPLSEFKDALVLHAGGVSWNGRHRSHPVAPVTDLVPLKALALQELYIGQTAVKDLTPLEGMPLIALYIGGTQVEDLTPLRNMKLETLDIQRTSIRDLSALRGMPLRELNASRAGNAFDFRSLSGMPLRDLNLHGTQVRDIGFMKDMPLERLNLSGTRVHNFTILRTLPLRRLDLSSTQIKDIALFRGQRLASLDLRDTSVSQIDVLRGMPLTNLDLSGTLVRDFSPLADLPLTRLNMVGCRVSDLDWARKIPLRHLSVAKTGISDLRPLKGKDLHYLDISHTSVTDLSPVKDFSIRHLAVRGTKANFGALRGTSVVRLDLDNPGAHLHVLRTIDGLRFINGMTMPQLMDVIRDEQRQRGGRRRP